MSSAPSARLNKPGFPGLLLCRTAGSCLCCKAGTPHPVSRGQRGDPGQHHVLEPHILGQRDVPIGIHARRTRGHLCLQ